MAAILTNGVPAAISSILSLPQRSRASAHLQHCQWLSAIGAVKHIVARRSPHRAAAPSNSQHFSQAPACHWYDNGGDRHVAAYLSERDISRFDPKAPPPKTPGFWAIVDANRAPEDAELADVLDRLGNHA